MDKIIFFDNNSTNNFCAGQKYLDFLDYAFSKSDFFMLVYVNYYGKGYTKIQKHFKSALDRFKVKCRSNPSWPGTLQTFCHNTTYKVIFYKTTDKAKAILKEVYQLSDWTRGYPEDLAFFIGNQCWFYSVGHEKIAAIIHASEKDLDFLDSKNLAKREKAYMAKDNYFDAYDEELINN